jgi:hypothetical protein
MILNGESEAGNLKPFTISGLYLLPRSLFSRKFHLLTKVQLVIFNGGKNPPSLNPPFGWLSFGGQAGTPASMVTVMFDQDEGQDKDRHPGLFFSCTRVLLLQAVTGRQGSGY